MRGQDLWSPWREDEDLTWHQGHVERKGVVPCGVEAVSCRRPCPSLGLHVSSLKEKAELAALWCREPRQEGCPGLSPSLGPGLWSALCLG